MSRRGTEAESQDAIAAVERFSLAIVAMPGLTTDAARLDCVLKGRLRLLLRRRRGEKIHLAVEIATPLSRAVHAAAAECGWLVSGHMGDGFGAMASLRANAGLIACYENVVLIGPQGNPCEVGRWYIELCRRLRRTWRVLRV